MGGVREEDERDWRWLTAIEKYTSRNAYLLCVPAQCQVSQVFFAGTEKRFAKLRDPKMW